MIDAHAHLLSSMLDAKQIIDNMQQDNLRYIINIGTSVKDSKEGISLANEHSNVFTTVGIHPEYANEVTDQILHEVEELAKEQKVVAIGEIGLDYHYGATKQEKIKQKYVFEKQIQIAHRLNLPIVVHCRDAAQDVYDILKHNKHLLGGGVCMHCYSEGASWAEQFASLGVYFSFTGNITYKKTDRSYLQSLPLDKILVETDCPYLSPEPLRGRINQPKNVWLTAQKVADVLQMSLADFEKQVEANTMKFFNIK